MTKKRLILYASVLISFSALSQEGVRFVFDDTLKKNVTVLIIPFNPKLYFNDVEKDIAEKNNLSNDQVIQFFRTNLDQNLYQALKDSCHVYSILQNFTYDDDEFVYRLYGSMNYFMDQAMDYDPDQGLHHPLSKIAIKPKKEKQYKDQTGIRNGQISSPVVNDADKFLNIRFSALEPFNYFEKKYKADILVFVNQFELRGDYSNPHKVQMNSHDMIIKIHYSVFDKNGKYLFGSFSAVKYPATITNIEEICKNYLPEAVKKIILHIPLKK